jgi:hypothetical protein
MEISGTLHFYSGEDKELFFVFDDDIAQQLYGEPQFDIDDLNSRRVYISVGADRFIHQRTLSFSRKQTEIKVSLCSRNTKDGLASLTTLYDWFSARGNPRPAPFPVLGRLARQRHNEQYVWELRITEPIGLIDPPGLTRRRKTPPPERRSYEHRRRFVQRDLESAGRPAEELAKELALADYPAPAYSCLWREEFLDSERIEIRKMGILADIDVWNEGQGIAELFIEVKAQKVLRRRADPIFYLSVGEWRSYERARKARIPYQVWLFQYISLDDFERAPERLSLIIFDKIDDDWLHPDGYLVTPGNASGKRYSVT